MASRRRILLVIPSIFGGGAERVFATLLGHLDRNRFELHLALLNLPSSTVQDLPPAVPIHDLKHTRVRSALPTLVKLIWEIRPDVVLSTLGHLNLAVIAVRPILPRHTRVFVRESTMIASVLLRNGIRHAWAWRWLYRGLYKRADRVVCPSGSILEELAENFGVPRNRMVRIYNPIDFDKVCNLAEGEGCPYEGTGPHLVTASRLSVEKGLDLLLDAMPEVLQSFPNAELTVLGEGRQLEELLEQSKKLALTSHVHFLGFQNNPWRYIRYAHLFVLPSRFEGLPNALLEALALGTRVVATDCPGSIREIQDCDPTMVLVPPETPGALAKAIISACGSARPREGFTQINERLRRFELHQVIEEYARILSGSSSA